MVGFFCLFFFFNPFKKGFELKDSELKAVLFFSLYKKESGDAVTDSSPQIPILRGLSF